MPTVLVVLLVFMAEPETAFPPVVLPLTLALPDLAVCELLFDTWTELFVITMVEELLSDNEMVLVEPGPVFVMLPDSGSTNGIGAGNRAPTPELSISTIVSVVLEFEAGPLVAFPPVVFPDTAALPVEEFCELELDTPTELLVTTEFVWLL